MEACPYTKKYPNILHCKILNTGTSKIIYVTVLKLNSFSKQYLCLKDVDGMANSVDPDQTAPLEAQLLRHICLNI